MRWFTGITSDLVRMLIVRDRGCRSVSARRRPGERRSLDPRTPSPGLRQRRARRTGIGLATPGAMSIDIAESMPMVKAFARRYRETSLGYDDAVGVGNLALVTASLTFDSSKGVPFGAYASFRVKGAMADALRTMRGTQKLPDQEVPMEHEEMAVRFSVEPKMCDATDIHAAIRRLNPIDRTVVMLVLAGHRSRDIAPMMGVSESRIAQRMSRVRKQLKGSR